MKKQLIMQRLPTKKIGKTTKDEHGIHSITQHRRMRLVTGIQVKKQQYYGMVVDLLSSVRLKIHQFFSSIRMKCNKS
jgi:hypothetical protein